MILWCGGEDIDFPVRNITINTATTARYRSAYSRCGLVLSSESYLYSPEFTPVSTFCFSCQIYVVSSVIGANQPFLQFIKSGASLRIGTSSISGTKLSISKFDGTTTTVLASEEGNSFPSGSLYKLDVQIIDYGANGTVNVYLDGVLKLTYTGDIAVLSQTTLNSIRFVSASNYYFDISEVIIADEDTRSMSLQTLAPNAAGDTNQWTGAYTDIDEVTNSDADLIQHDTVDEIFTCNLTGLPSNNFVVKAVKISARMSPSAQDIGVQLGVKTNSALHYGATIEPPWWATGEKIFETNPETAVAFTVGEINALQFAAKLVTA